METLSLNWWSTRAISSRTLVGELLPPRNCVPDVGVGKILAASRAWAFESNKPEGIALFGKGWATVTLPLLSQVLRLSPALAYWAAIAGETWVAHGVWRVTPVPEKFRSE